MILFPYENAQFISLGRKIYIYIYCIIIMIFKMYLIVILFNYVYCVF